MKKRQLSLAAKVNILIILITLAISLLLVVISNINYRKALIEPYQQKLTDIVIPQDELLPYMDFFAGWFGTEELQQVRADTDKDSGRMIDWLDEKSSFTADDPEYARDSMFLDLIAFEYTIDEIMESAEMDEICAEVLKGGTVYRIAEIDKTRGYSRTEEFGGELPFSSIQPEEVSSSRLIKFGEQYCYLRCVKIEGDGWEGRIWMAYDMTEAIREHRGFVVRSVLYILILTAVASVISVYLLRRYVTKPIRMLAQAATEFEPEEDGTYSSDRISKVEIPSGDELGDLSREIRSMQTRIVENTGNLTRMTAEKERINTELSMAKQIQESMLPSIFPPFPDRKEFELFAAMTPAREVGGDFYDFFMIDNDHLALVMADVSGKGVPAALFMMVSKAILKNNAMSGRSPGEILSITNDLICSNNRMQMFVTVWLGILEITTGKIVAANAGHEYPILKTESEFTLLREKHGFVLAGMEGMKYKEYEMQLNPKDKLFLYTDGVTEATDADNNAFGIERVLTALNRDPEASPQQLIGSVRKDIDSFVNGAEQFDDITMLCIEYKGFQ